MDAIVLTVCLAAFGIAVGITMILFRRKLRGDRAVGAGDLLLLFVTAVVTLCLSPLIFLQVGIILLAAIIGWALSVRHSVATAGVWLATAAAFGIIVSTAIAQLRFLNRLRAEYPFESLAGRLAYERGAMAVNAASQEQSRLDDITSSFTPLPQEIEKRLTKQEVWTQYSYRSDALERLHSKYRDRFVMAQGFGYGRMAGIRTFKLREPESEAAQIKMPAGGAIYSAETNLLEPEVGEDFRGLPSVGGLETMAESVERDFLNPMRFGFALDGKVTGFIGHRLAERISDPRGANDKYTPWQADRVELVSLLKFTEPAVYLSEELPNMERLANVPTRPLNVFEGEALAKLRTEEDLVVRYSANTIRMLGSLRAGTTCLECHSVRRGELLGAFSYELRRMPPIPAPEKPPASGKPEA